MFKAVFDNSNVQVVLSPISDNYDESFEESSVCYPTTEGWEFVVGFEVPEAWYRNHRLTDCPPVEEWRINYLGSYGLKDGKTDIRDFADNLPNMSHPEDPSIGKFLGKQTLRMLPDEGSYVKHIFQYLDLRERRDVVAEECFGISEAISHIEYQLEDPTSDSSRIAAKRGELASLKDELEKAKERHTHVGAMLEEHVGKDPTFLITD